MGTVGYIDNSGMSLGEKLRSMGQSLLSDNNDKRRLEMAQMQDAKVMHARTIRFETTQDRIEQKQDDELGVSPRARAMPQSVAGSFNAREGVQFHAMALRA